MQGNFFSINYKLRALFIVFTLFILSFANFGRSFADCRPAFDDYNATNIGAPLLDNIIGLISDGIFGPRTESGSAFTKVANFGDRNWEEGIVYKTFHGITGDTRFQVVFYLLVVLYITFLGTQFALGSMQVSAKDLLMKYIKIAFIVFLISPTGWEVYLEFIAKNVLEASRYFNRVITASMYNVPISQITSPFQPIDMVIGTIFAETTWVKIGALFWANGFLFTAMLIVIFLYVIVMTGIVVLKVTIMYSAIITIVAVLLSVGPIFIICLMFDRTKSYFDKWIKNIIGLFFEQYLLFLGFFIFCLILSLMIKGLLAFEICMAPIIELKFMVKTPKFIRVIIDGLFSLVSWLGIRKPDIGEYLINVKYVVLEGYKPTGMAFDLPSNIFSAGGIFIVATMFSKFIDGVTSLSQKISGADMSSKGLADSALKNPFDSESKGMLANLRDAESAVTSAAIKASAHIVTGSAFITAPNALKNKAQEIAKDIKMREMDPDKQDGLSKFITKAMKLEQKAFSGASKVLGSGLTSKLVQTSQDLAEVNKMEGLKKSRQELTSREIHKLVGKGKKYSSASEITDEDRKEIMQTVEAKMVSEVANAEIKELEKSGMKISEGLKKNIHAMAQKDVARSHNTEIKKYTAAGMVSGTVTNSAQGFKDAIKGVNRGNIMQKIKDGSLVKDIAKQTFSTKNIGAASTIPKTNDFKDRGWFRRKIHRAKRAVKNNVLK